MDNNSEIIKLAEYLTLCFYLDFEVDNITLDRKRAKVWKSKYDNEYEDDEIYTDSSDDDDDKFIDTFINNLKNKSKFRGYNNLLLDVLNYESNEEFLKKYKTLLNNIDNYVINCDEVIIEVYNERDSWFENIFNSTESEHKREQYIFNYDSEFIKLSDIRNRIFNKINNESSFTYHGILNIDNNILKLCITY